jgi:hypothetical protein
MLSAFRVAVLFALLANSAWGEKRPRRLRRFRERISVLAFGFVAATFAADRSWWALPTGIVALAVIPGAIYEQRTEMESPTVSEWVQSRWARVRSHDG